MDNLITEINTEIQLKEAFAEFLGVELADIPAELLDEAMGGRTLGMADMDPEMGAARGRAAELDWVSDMKSRQDAAKKRPSTFRDPTKGGAPAAMRPEMEDPKAGDFVVVGGKPVKIVDIKQMFGGMDFVYLQGVRKPVMMDRLNLHKRVGKVNVFSLK